MFIFNVFFLFVKFWHHVRLVFDQEQFMLRPDYDILRLYLDLFWVFMLLEMTRQVLAHRSLCYFKTTKT